VNEPQQRTEEVYSVECHVCFTEQDLPAAAVDAKGKAICKRCGTILRVNWRPEGTAA
jgi:uncharacterized paraquat-inducible protein A